MLLTISTTYKPATDLGYLLYKNPARLQTFALSFGCAHVFYPDAADDLCTAALLLDVDPVALVRRRQHGGQEGSLWQYVNDRPYVASSFLSVAIAEVYGSALSGNSRERRELAATAIPLKAKLCAVAVHGPPDILPRLFEPLGYTLESKRHPLDPLIAEWGQSCYYTVSIEGTLPLAGLLSHLYVLIPVLDNEKHYFVGEDEVEKLLRHGEGWLSTHPERDLIARRYLKHRQSLTRQALSRLAEEDNLDPDQREQAHTSEEAAIENKLSLNQMRLAAVIAQLRQAGSKSVLDLGCGEGKLLGALMKEPQFEQITGLDVSHAALEIACDRLKISQLPDRQKERLKLIHGSLTYKDKRLSGFDAATCIEVIEHLDLYRLAAFESVVFQWARPATVILTTPNLEYNVKFETLPQGKLRHKDHRFEWTREQFRSWSLSVAQRFGYKVSFEDVGESDKDLGPPTQMGVFRREADNS